MQQTEQWGIFEITLPGPSSGNPFVDVQISAEFSHLHRTINVDGFYDGAGQFKLRFMPDHTGDWTYRTKSNAAVLDACTGAFLCVPPAHSNHGPVRLAHRTHFAYADGTPYRPMGTTCYVWNHQVDGLEELTLSTLAEAPFNKLRMCLFPKDYAYNRNEPVYYPYEGEPPTQWDFSRFNPAFFAHLERRVGDLRDLGIEADLILFHPYDRWGFSSMDTEADDRYLRYVVARLAAHRNLWWSFANEFDLMETKTEADWDRFFRIVWEHDPYGRLRSIHNCRGFYDHGKPWVTHCSIQSSDLDRVGLWIEQYQKPVVVDECRYEGNIPQGWGNITAVEMVHRFWTGFTAGGYVGHGETYVHPEDILWWSRGGELHGSSPSRIAFLKTLFDEAPQEPMHALPNAGRRSAWGIPGRYYLYYLGDSQPAYSFFDLPDDQRFQADIVDTWDMKVTPVPGMHSGKVRIDLPTKPYLAVRFAAAE